MNIRQAARNTFRKPELLSDEEIEERADFTYYWIGGALIVVIILRVVVGW